MLLGFFTYKAAVIAKTGLSLLGDLSKGTQQMNEESAPADAQSNALTASYSQQILTK